MAKFLLNLVIFNSLFHICYCIEYKCENDGMLGIQCNISDIQNWRDVHMNRLPGSMFQCLIIKANDLVLNGDLDLNQTRISATGGLVFETLNGFELTSNPFSFYANKDWSLNLLISLSKFDFYFENLLVDRATCEKLLRSNNSQLQLNNSFLSLNRMMLLLSRTNTYFRKICPIAFANASLQTLQVNGVEDSLLLRNVFEFEDFDFDYSHAVSSANIQWILFEVYRIKLKRHALLNEYLLSKTNSITFVGQIDSIDDDAFENLNAPQVHLSNSNFVEFFHRVGIEWTRSLNRNKKNTPVTLIFYEANKNTQYFTIIFSNYFYPDADLCVFERFPHDQLVYPELSYFANSTCTCTIVFLIQFSIRVSDYDPANPCNNLSMSELVKNCDFASKFEMCNLNQTHPSFFLPTLRDIEMELGVADYILSIILMPICCINGILTNILVVLVIKRYKTVDFKEKMYDFMLANAIGNILHCSLYIFHMINICIQENGLFCSSIRENPMSQYFEIYVINYLSGVLKMFSSTSLILLSLERYLLITDFSMTNRADGDHFAPKRYILKVISSASISTLMTIILVLSLSLNVIQFFQYTETNYSFNDLYSIYDLDFPKIHDRPEAVKASFALYVCFLTLCFVLNDVVSFVMALVFDVFLLRAIRRNVENVRSKFQVNGSSPSAELVKKLHAERKAIKMVVVSNLSLVILRLPDFMASLYTVVSNISEADSRRFSSNDMYAICFMTSSRVCIMIADMSQPFFIFSYSVLFFVYYGFNKKFRQNTKRYLNENLYVFK
jgi:hypothetical protein